MTDREEDIKAVEYLNWYFTQDDGTADENAVKAWEVLSRKQEPVDAIRDGESYGKGDFGAWWYACGNCHGVIDHKDLFCRHCGREVKWDG